MDGKHWLSVKENQEYYCMNRKILVLKICAAVHMAKVKWVDTGDEFFIDMSAILNFPIYERSISIKILGGE